MPEGLLTPLSPVPRKLACSCALPQLCWPCSFRALGVLLHAGDVCRKKGWCRIYCLLLPLLPPIKANGYHSSSQLLPSAQHPRKPSLWALTKYGSNDKVVFMGSSAGWILSAWRFLFIQLLRLVSVLRDELRCFSLLVSACSAVQ